MKGNKLLLWHMVGNVAEAGAITDLAATANLDGTITVSWTLPANATAALVRYNVDQPAAPSQPYLGIGLGLTVGTSVVLSGVEYGATYRFSAWAHGAGGYSNGRDTASAVGPLNPLAYSSYLNLWLDARRETPLTDDTDDTAPTDWSGASQPFTAGTNPPHFRTIAGGGALAGNACWEWALPATESRQWHAGTVALQHATRGLTVASLVQCADAAHTPSKQILTRWETATADRAFALGKGSGEYTLTVSADGTAEHQAATSGCDDTDPHGLVGVWKPSAWTAIYADGTEHERDVTSPPATMYASSVEELRSGGARHNAGDAWYGKKAIELAYSEALSPLAAILLSDALAAIGGV